MRTITKIACRTMGLVGIGASLYDATRLSGQLSRNTAQYEQAKYLEKKYFNARTLDSTSFSRDAIQETTHNYLSKQPIPAIWGQIKGGFLGLMYGLGNNLLTISCGALALTCKNTLAKIGAAGVGLGILYTIARDGFGLGKVHPMD